MSVCLPEPSSCSLSDIRTALRNVIAVDSSVYPLNRSIVGLSGWVGCHGYNVCVLVVKSSMCHLAGISVAMAYLCVHVQLMKRVSEQLLSNKVDE